MGVLTQLLQGQQKCNVRHLMQPFIVFAYYMYDLYNLSVSHTKTSTPIGAQRATCFNESKYGQTDGQSNL